MLTINLEYYQTGYDDANVFDQNGKGKNFYPTTDAQITEIGETKNIEIVITAGANTSKWNEPSDPVLRKNIYTLLEHEKLSNILVRKSNLINIFRTTKSQEASEALKKYMDNIIPILRNILKNTHNLYWVDDKRYIRSAISFEECLKKSIDFAYDTLRINNLITSVSNPSGILNSQINDQIDNITTGQYRALGGREIIATSKSKSKKTKK